MSTDPWDDAHSVPALLTHASDAPGSAVDDAPQRYEHRGQIGAGGMGEVEVVYDRWLGREVARKAFVTGQPSRLAREAAITALLEHPSIVPVFDTGEGADGRRYYTMRLVRGQTLLARLHGAALADRLNLVDAVARVTEAVAYAHSRGIVHRDLKPTNIVLGAFGEVQLIDWGIAATTGDVLPGEGTRWYAPAEQLSGGPARQEHDVYALGRTLHHLLAGEAEQPLPAEAPPDLVAIADCACREGGYAGAAALADDLRRWLAGQRVNAHAYTRSELLRRTVNEHRIPLSAGALALVAIAGFGAYTVVQTGRERDRALAAEAQAEAHLTDLLSAQAVSAFERGALPEAEQLAADALTHRDDPLARGVLAAYQPDRPVFVGTYPLPCADPLALDSHQLLCLGPEGATLVEPATRDTQALPWPGITDARSRPDGYELLLARDAKSSLHWMQLDTALQPVARAEVPIAPFASGPGPAAFNHSTDPLLQVDGVLQPWEPCPGATPTQHHLAWRDPQWAAWTCSDGLRVGDPTQPAEARRALPFYDDSDLVWAGDDLVLAAYVERLMLVRDGRLADSIPVEGGVPQRIAGTEGWVVSEPERGGVRQYRTDPLAWHGTLPQAAGGRPVLVDDTLQLVGEQVTRWRLAEPGQPHRTALPGGVTSLAWADDDTLAVGTGQHLALLHPDGTQRLIAMSDSCRVLKDVAWGPAGDIVTLCAGSQQPARRYRRDGRFTELGGSAIGPRLALNADGLTALTYATADVFQHWDGTSSLLVRPTPSTGVDLESRDGIPIVLYDNGRLGPLLPTGPALFDWEAPGFYALALDPTSADLLLSDGERLQRRSDDGDVRWTAPTHSRVTDVAWSPDGELVAAGLLDGKTLVLHAADGAVLAQLPGHLQRVAAVAFRHDSALLATGSWDQSVRLWDTRALRDPPTADVIAARYGHLPPRVR